VRIRTFGFGSHADVTIVNVVTKPGEQAVTLRDERGMTHRFSLLVPGKMNVLDAVGAWVMATSYGVLPEVASEALGSFKGIWRRFERIAEKDAITVVSDYGHHPTAVRVNLEAARQFFPASRIVLCYQPHHRARTRDLFEDFVTCFDRADALVLVEIYDVAGREEDHCEPMSSRDLQEAILRHDAERGVVRPVEYALAPEAALTILRRWAKPGDLVLVMGAGDIYHIAPDILV
jgi:UDP-N-acetylmuramate--alanine ligase